jgi:deazaflavin-dependent oxidoreductase (nitroreductase family)
MEEVLMRRAFWVLNKFFMVPMIRLGLLPFMGTPVTGWVMMLTTTGHKTGKRRFTPVNYALINGDVYCLAGFGHRAHWYRNIQADAHVEAWLPSRPVAGRAEEVADPDERLGAIRQVLKNSGFATFLFGGINPFRIPDDRLREKVEDYCVIRIRPSGVGSGVGDPGGLLWVWWVATIVAAVVALMIILR